MILLFIFCWY